MWAKEAAFSTAVTIEELRQHVFPLLGYQSPNTTTGISSFLPETLIGLAATNPIGHWRLAMWIDTELALLKSALIYCSERGSETEEEENNDNNSAVSLRPGDSAWEWVRDSESNCTAMGRDGHERDRNGRVCLPQPLRTHSLYESSWTCSPTAFVFCAVLLMCCHTALIREILINTHTVKENIFAAETSLYLSPKSQLSWIEWPLLYPRTDPPHTHTSYRGATERLKAMQRLCLFSRCFKYHCGHFVSVWLLCVSVILPLWSFYISLKSFCVYLWLFLTSLRSFRVSLCSFSVSLWSSFRQHCRIVLVFDVKSLYFQY